MRDGLITEIRYWLILKLAKDMPVVLNMRIERPSGFKGDLIHLPAPKLTGMIHGCCLNSDMTTNAILTPKRDYKHLKGVGQ